ncbi:hypothetical protein OSTOST_10874 [Ostertagia ostertagi]
MQRGRQLKKPAHIMATPPKPVIKPVTPTSKDETVNGEWIPRWNPWYGPMGFPWICKKAMDQQLPSQEPLLSATVDFTKFNSMA